ncbi:MAG: hypothetical protein COV67_04090 [Nitrospinae bacterium CG11_big_fil_rev_8_21_14_0_20_56_8]|nr:MAG: hypothetical protein COV67_04090 [Nitrospinae bacterium CG11_big_fil_rev_8_21_14_0_20_56_8]
MIFRKPGTQLSPKYLTILGGLILVLGFPGTGRAEPGTAALRKGVDSYHNKEYEKARDLFLQSRQADPQNPKIAYNLGSSQYRLGKFQDALQTYQQSLSTQGKPDELKEKTLYNTGNALYRMGKLREAADTYKQALKLNPTDMDAKFNMEYIQEKLKQQEEQKAKESPDSKDKEPKQDNQGDSGKKEEQDKKPPEPGKPSDPQSREHSGTGQPEKSAKQDSSPPKASASSSARPDSDHALTPQEAERWLRSLNEDLKKFQQRQAANSKPSTSYPRNDW